MQDRGGLQAGMGRWAEHGLCDEEHPAGQGAVRPAGERPPSTPASTADRSLSAKMTRETRVTIFARSRFTAPGRAGLLRQARKYLLEGITGRGTAGLLRAAALSCAAAAPQVHGQEHPQVVVVPQGGVAGIGALHNGQRLRRHRHQLASCCRARAEIGPLVTGRVPCSGNAPPKPLVMRSRRAGTAAPPSAARAREEIVWERILKLLSVKSLVTLALTGTLCALLFSNTAPPQELSPDGQHQPGIVAVGHTACSGTGSG